jgi:dephospho-CoA kinase
MSADSVYSKVTVLTGTSGAGKSTAANILEGLGAHIISADLLARQVVEFGSEGLNQLVLTFGESILLDDRCLDRKKLHLILVSDPHKREQIEKILHPLIKLKAKQDFSELIKKDLSPIIYDCPLYFEKELNKLEFKQSILVVADEEKVLERIIKRDNISKADAILRINSQMSQNEKIKLADIVIENNGSIDDLKTKLSKIYSDL